MIWTKATRKNLLSEPWCWSLQTETKHIISIGETLIEKLKTQGKKMLEILTLALPQNKTSLIWSWNCAESAGASAEERWQLLLILALFAVPLIISSRRRHLSCDWSPLYTFLSVSLSLCSLVLMYIGLCSVFKEFALFIGDMGLLTSYLKKQIERIINLGGLGAIRCWRSHKHLDRSLLIYKIYYLYIKN